MTSPVLPGASIIGGLRCCELMLAMAVRIFNANVLEKLYWGNFLWVTITQAMRSYSAICTSACHSLQNRRDLYRATRCAHKRAIFSYQGDVRSQADAKLASSWKATYLAGILQLAMDLYMLLFSDPVRTNICTKQAGAEHRLDMASDYCGEISWKFMMAALGCRWASGLIMKHQVCRMTGKI